MKPNASKVLRSAPAVADSQHSALSTLSRIMLATCALLLFSLTGLRAQHNSEYKFRLQSVADGDRYNTSIDDAPIRSMGCLAANGYGHWAFAPTCGHTQHVPALEGI